MFDQILELFYEAPWLLVLLGSVVAVIGFYFWNIWASPAVREALRDVSERLIYAREASAGLAQSFQSLDTGFRSRVE